MIAVDLMIGLDKLSEEYLRRIHFKAFRPITLAMALELLYGKQLQDKYKLV